MWRNNRRLRKCHGLQLEFLESRELLSAAHRPHKPAEVSRIAAGPKQVYGSLAGQGVMTGNGKRGLLGFSAAGPEAPVGVGTFTGSARYKAERLNGVLWGYEVSNGTGTLTDSSGDKINLQYSGTIYESGTSYAFSWTGTVDGGTGQFRGAAGNLDAYGTYSVSTGQFEVLGYSATLRRR
jgi:hypothetical protein